jgi:signal transduction histidine kinase
MSLRSGRLTDSDHSTFAAGLFDWSERLVGIDGASIHMRTENGLELTWAAEAGNIHPAARQLDEHGPGPIARASRTAVTQIASEDEDLQGPVLRAFGWKSAVCVPLILEARVVGVFSAGWRSPVPVSDDMRLILETAASMSVAVLYQIGLVQDLKREQERLRSVLEGLPVSASIIDIAGPRVRWRNKQARDYFGDINAGDALKVTLGEHPTAGDDRIGDHDRHYQSMLRGETPPDRIEVGTADGQHRILAPTIARLDNELAVVIHVDVTRDVHIDHERARFVRMVSHHLRTPLTPLLGFVQLMADPTLDQPTRTEAIQTIEHSVLEITHLVTRLEQINSLQPVDRQAMSQPTVGRLVHEAWTGIEGADDLQLEVYGATDTKVRCAPSHVVAAMREIFANAVSHGQPPISVSISLDTDVDIRISDHGEGIPAEWEQAIFAPFMSIEDGYIAPPADHPGLGLTLARALILATRGELSYSNGAFTIQLLPADA